VWSWPKHANPEIRYKGTGRAGHLRRGELASELPCVRNLRKNVSSEHNVEAFGGENLIDLSVTARNGKFNADQDVIDAAVIVFGR